MALENYRITEFQEKTQVDNGDYVLIDSATDGTHKYQLSRIPAQASAEVDAAVAAEKTAREAADAAEVTARNAAISAAISDEVTARNAAIAANVDDTLSVTGKAADAKKTGDEIADLKSDLTAEQTARENADTALQTAINAKADSTALTAEQTARQNADNALGEDITALSEDMETNYARIDGYYDSLGVGMADQLASNKYTEDNEPYVYRTSGGTADIGDREYDEIVGGTVAWNQLIKSNATSSNVGGVTITNNSDGGYTLNGTTEGAGTFYINSPYADTFYDGHVYLLCGWKKTANDADSYFGISGLKIDDGNGGIYKKSGTVSNWVYRFDIKSGATFDNLKVYPQAFDLTQMFGTAVADAIYALEQAEAGAGVAWFKKLFPKDYYEYNAGELLSVSALQSHDMVGFNQWDGETADGYWDVNTGAFTPSANWMSSKNHIPVLPDTQYYIKGDETKTSSFGALVFYDADKKYISGTNSSHKNTTFTTPENCHYMTFYANNIYKDTDICINLSWSGWRNGEYEAYDKHSYPLDSSLTLRGIPKVDSAGNMYYDGDIYSPDGTVTRRYKKIVIDGNSNVETGASGMPFRLTLNDKKMLQTSSDAPNGISDKLTGVTQASTWGVPFTFSFISLHNAMYFKLSDDITAVADAKTYLASNPITLVYELATPTTETAQPYASPQIVDDFGTEEYVSTADVRIPVGHNTKYMANLRDKLVHLPNLADSDGAYLIQQTGHTMELVKFRIPKAPTTDGTYTLKATVSGGTPTYTWEVVE